MKQRTYLPQASILLAGICWGLIGLFSRNLLNSGVTPQDIVLIRNAGGLALLALMLLAADRKAFRISLRQLPWCAGTGLVSVLLFTLCYFSCQQYCSLATAAILLYTAPAFVVVMSALLWREPITRRKLVALGLAFLGCTFVSGVWSGGLSVNSTGLLLGLGSAFFYALYSIFGRYALRGSPPMTVVLYTFVFAGGGALLVGDPGAVASALAGAAGVLYAMNYSTITPSQFDFNQSILILVYVVLGGMGNISGSIISAAFLTVLPEVLRPINNYRMLIYAVVLILVMVVPNTKLYQRAAEALRSKLRRESKTPAAATEGGEGNE